MALKDYKNVGQKNGCDLYSGKALSLFLHYSHEQNQNVMKTITLIFFQFPSLGKLSKIMYAFKRL